MKDLYTLPKNLPIPTDDGACDHLVGSRIPAISLLATSGEVINLDTLSGAVVIYFYPMIGRPESRPLDGWNEIPGARGCTPQSCAFRDNYVELMHFADNIFGASSQSLEEQKEAKARLDLPYELINDSDYILTEAMRLPTFNYKNSRLIKRLTVISINSIIQKVFYPVFPPNQNAEDVLNWFSNR